ncbi:hypothetical protein TRIATDRAFT_256950 [Trichoderma atroviride IMI 206040]|uniref:Uncharacterized protein n=1 Tax=Hypocrea atroviridis (strain ATCC 20476 / IMI 206040) TaxID=452589 RepID=G9NX89_HYPAI|nr:uncharacterized protein TRIATDRAFT_256950 [Trichoderma atroviride IMI 206040]EHK44700.1 hypothetical protein TRIATDRAFT_256950 [Trichoderma atroviride IMI 206040]
MFVLSTRKRPAILAAGPPGRFPNRAAWSNSATGHERRSLPLGPTTCRPVDCKEKALASDE